MRYDRIEAGSTSERPTVYPPPYRSIKGKLRKWTVDRSSEVFDDSQNLNSVIANVLLFQCCPWVIHHFVLDVKHHQSIRDSIFPCEFVGAGEVSQAFEIWVPDEVEYIAEANGIQFLIVEVDFVVLAFLEVEERTPVWA